MNTRNAFLALIFFIAFLLDPRHTTTVIAEGGSDRVLIKIGEHAIQPAQLNVVPGTTVLWKNTASYPVKVSFISHGVTTTCKEPLGFGFDSFGIQESSHISGGAVASLCFLEPKDYRYRVEGAEGAYEGTIHVSQVR